MDSAFDYRVCWNLNHGLAQPGPPISQMGSQAFCSCHTLSGWVEVRTGPFPPLDSSASSTELWPGPGLPPLLLRNLQVMTGSCSTPTAHGQSGHCRAGKPTQISVGRPEAGGRVSGCPTCHSGSASIFSVGQSPGAAPSALCPCLSTGASASW